MKPRRLVNPLPGRCIPIPGCMRAEWCDRWAGGAFGGVVWAFGVEGWWCGWWVSMVWGGGEQGVVGLGAVVVGVGGVWPIGQRRTISALVANVVDEKLDNSPILSRLI